MAFRDNSKPDATLRNFKVRLPDGTIIGFVRAVTKAQALAIAARAHPKAKDITVQGPNVMMAKGGKTRRIARVVPEVEIKQKLAA